VDPQAAVSTKVNAENRRRARACPVKSCLTGQKPVW
jgi:hypothetical protein